MWRNSAGTAVVALPQTVSPPLLLPSRERLPRVSLPDRQSVKQGEVEAAGQIKTDSR